MSNWFEKRLQSELEDPEFKEMWEKDKWKGQFINCLVQNGVPFTQELLDCLDAMDNKGLVVSIVPAPEKIHSSKKVLELETE